MAGSAAQAEDWPCFRGPSRQGLSQEKDVPTEWSATSNVKWKTAIPGEGWSSPIVLGDDVFVTTALDAPPPANPAEPPAAAPGENPMPAAGENPAPGENPGQPQARARDTIDPALALRWLEACPA